jgi:hypothetical protein
VFCRLDIGLMVKYFYEAAGIDTAFIQDGVPENSIGIV